MRYLWQHIEQILEQYRGELPLHHFLKRYFKGQPKLGSRDRRGLSDAIYAWYRAGKALAGNNHDIESLRLAAMYLCGLQPRAFEAFIPESWGMPPAEPEDRIAVLAAHGFVISAEQIFPFNISFSAGMTPEAWRISMLRQPRLFLRIGSGQAAATRLLEAAGLSFEWISPTCLALPNGTKVEALLSPDAYVVQDASSQATGSYLAANAGEAWWDCCSGAGGKSLMLKDGTPDVELLATDVRQSILSNLQERFRLYHHTLPAVATLDAADAGSTTRFMGSRRFAGIICDVPCSGSGTWGRTPESAYFFDPKTVAEYSRRQTAILRNAAEYLAPDGRIIYITCSVFSAENEAVVEAVAAEGKLRIVSAGLINGLSIGADALFAAELRLA